MSQYVSGEDIARKSSQHTLTAVPEKSATTRPMIINIHFNDDVASGVRVRHSNKIFPFVDLFYARLSKRSARSLHKCTPVHSVDFLVVVGEEDWTCGARGMINFCSRYLI